MADTHGFTLIGKRHIAELKTGAKLYRHLKTGAELLSLSNDDTNKVFGITFRTPPADSTGVAHILEHSVLCGSKKYPVKEPFVELLKGSLQTFLNAFTYPDKTCYPVASQNLKDFYNLIDVYLDAVFYPRLSPLIFQQEGWQYELDDPAGPLSYKGVVYNEMKGAYSSPDSILSHHSQAAVFPDTVYGLDAGGDPKHIPDLTYEQFREFHRRLYHPANSRIYFYGNDDPDERLRYMARQLEPFGPLAARSAISLQHALSAPRYITKPFPAGESDAAAGKGMVTVNWLLPEVKDTDAAMALSVLEHLLLGMPASPLRKALLDSGLGDGLAGVGLETELAQMYLSTGLKGVAGQHLDRVEPFILETLDGLARGGIDPLTAEAAMNTVEFRLRENNTGRFPRGLVLMLRSLTTWLYGGDPFLMLAFEQPLNRLKAHLRDRPTFFQDLIKTWLVNNLHRVAVTLKPDAAMAVRDAQEEQQRLQGIRSSMSDDDVRAAAEATRAIKLMQQTPDTAEALASIPRLRLADIEKHNRPVPCEHRGENGTGVVYHNLFTGGIMYADIGLNLHRLPQQYLPFVPLFGRALLETDTDKEDFVSLSQRIGRTTGGIRTSLFTSAVCGSGEATAWLFLRGKAMTHQAPALFGILADIFSGARLDNRQRFKQILLEEKAAQEQKLIPAGHQVVSTRLRAHFSEADWADEQMSGISHLFFLRELAEKIDADWPGVLSCLEEMRSILISSSSVLANLTVDEASRGKIEPLAETFLRGLPQSTVPAVSWAPVLPAPCEALTLPCMVNYVSKGANLYDLGYRYHGSVHVIAHVLRTSWLWEQVRVQGGAYGGFCSFDRMSGGFVFVSYRDPNLLATLDVFDRAAHFLSDTCLRHDELEKSIIGAIGDIDAYLLPDAMGFVSLQRLLNGNTDEIRQRMREEVLGTTPADLRNFAGVLREVGSRGIVKVLGSESAVKEANGMRRDFLTPVRVL